VTSRSSVAVWWADLEDARPSHVALLNGVERARRERFARPADRDRFTLGVALTRCVVGQRLGQVPEAVRLDRTCPTCGAPHGRPRLVDPASSLRISVSHSGNRVVVAIADRGDVGVDVEASGTELDVDGLGTSVLTPAERAELDRSPADLREIGFLTYWTRKEAVLKATGDGLRVDPDRFTVSVPGEPPRILDWPERPDLPSRISLHTLDPGPGHVACLALLDVSGAEVDQRSAERLGLC
jgi:4'-phosphopantetheinyl transferase